MKRFKIALEQQSFVSNDFENHTVLSFANEGIVENFASFVQRSISSEEGLRKSIQGLQGKRVIQVTDIEYAEKYSGLRLLNTDKVTGEYILKYLKKVNSEIDYNTDQVTDLFEFLVKIMQKNNTTSEEQNERNMNNIRKEISETEKDLQILKQINQEGENRKQFSITTCEQSDFDSIVKGIEILIKKNNEYIKRLKDYQEDVVSWHMYGMVPKDNNKDGVVSLGYLAIRTVIEYLENFRIFEKKFLFSLTKYLQACIK